MENVDLTAITTPLCLLDDETREALKAHGGPYEYLSHVGEWGETDAVPLWTANKVYRVKPGPRRETVKAWLTCAPPKYHWEATPITFDLIDGKPDWSSVKPAESEQ